MEVALTKENIEAIIAAEIRPALQGHGGDCKVVDLKDNQVFLELTGGCKGCPGARATIKNGVERILQETFPNLEVIDSTDHAI
ncbi:MAG: NifU family protein [Bacteriovoracaceae bacterium]|nr:NifU family protein [Bacteriovoracaceae bacterium]